MAGHVQDRWYKTEIIDGKRSKVKTDRYGVGKRYRARYVGPDGTEKSQSFPDRKKGEADEWLTNIEADMSRGQYVDRTAGQITLRAYGEKWLASRTGDQGTLVCVEQRLRLHVFPYLGSRPLVSITSEHIRGWLAELERNNLAGAYRKVIFAHLVTLFNGAVDSKRIASNPCQSSSVIVPQPDSRRVVPWPEERVFAVQAGLPEFFQPVVDLAAGCGFRQGEVFGLALDALDFEGDEIHVIRQVKLIRDRPVFAPPKGGKCRTAPMSSEVAKSLRDHMAEFPPVEVTLPWMRLDGDPTTVKLLFYRKGGREVGRYDFNRAVWHPALWSAGVEPSRANGMHALRHFFASVVLDAGESIKTLSEILGHADPAFTLRVYTHFMPSSKKRTMSAVDAVFGRRHDHGPQTAHDEG